MFYKAILVLILLFSVRINANPHAYSGKIATFAKSEKFIALHEHGYTFDSQTLKTKSYSYIDIYQKSGSNIGNKVSFSSPRLVALSWTQNSEYLVGISNIMEGNMINMIVYAQDGNEKLRFDAQCNIDKKWSSSMLCAHSAEQHWVNMQLSWFTANLSKQIIRVCIGQLCENLDVSVSN
jgi:hypothetical protein